MTDTYLLYKITNIVNNKVYIGITKDLKRRWTVHCSSGSKCLKLKAAISKYGRDNFRKEVLLYGSKEYVLDIEEKYIAACDSVNTGYNIHKGGKFYKSEHKIPNNSASSPVFVTGFWFPDQQTAVDTLNIKLGTFYAWKRKDTLGDLCHPRGGNKQPSPVNIKGFWFPSVYKAMDVLNISLGQAYKLAKQQNKQVDDLRTGSQKGGKSKTAQPVYVEGTLYSAIRTASDETGIPRSTIKRRIENKVDGYSFYEEV